MDGAGIDVDACHPHPDVVAGIDVVGRDAHEHRGVGELDHGAAAVLVDDDGVEHLADASGEQHRLGEVDDGGVDAVGQRLPVGHRRRQRGERLLDVVGNGAPVGHRQRGLDDVPVGEPPQRGGGMRVRRGHRRVPWQHPGGVRLVARSAAGAADGDEERRAPGVARRQRALEVGEGQLGRPRQPERPGGVTQPPERPVVGVGHHAEQPGPGGVQRGGDREVGGERHPGVVILALQAGREAQHPMAVHPLELLLGELDARRAARVLGDLDPPGELGELGRQLVGRDRRVGELGPAVHDRPLDAVEADRTGGVDTDREHDRRARAVGQQAGRPLATAPRG